MREQEEVLILSDCDHDGAIISNSGKIIQKVLSGLARGRTIVECVAFVTIRPERTWLHDQNRLDRLRTLGITLQCIEPTPAKNPQTQRIRSEGYPDQVMIDYMDNALQRLDAHQITVIFISSDSDFVHFAAQLTQREIKAELAIRSRVRKKIGRMLKQLSLPNVPVHNIDSYLQS